MVPQTSSRMEKHHVVLFLAAKLEMLRAGGARRTPMNRTRTPRRPRRSAPSPAGTWRRSSRASCWPSSPSTARPTSSARRPASSPSARRSRPPTPRRPPTRSSSRRRHLQDHDGRHRHGQLGGRAGHRRQRQPDDREHQRRDRHHRRRRASSASSTSTPVDTRGVHRNLPGPDHHRRRRWAGHRRGGGIDVDGAASVALISATSPATSRDGGGGIALEAGAPAR